MNRLVVENKHNAYKYITIADRIPTSLKLRRGEGRLREPMGGLRHAIGSLRRTEGGRDGSRTHVPVLPDHPISNRRRYDLFGTLPYIQNTLN